MLGLYVLAKQNMTARNIIIKCAVCCRPASVTRTRQHHCTEYITQSQQQQHWSRDTPVGVVKTLQVIASSWLLLLMSVARVCYWFRRRRQRPSLGLATAAAAAAAEDFVSVIDWPVGHCWWSFIGHWSVHQPPSAGHRGRAASCKLRHFELNISNQEFTKK